MKLYADIYYCGSMPPPEGYKDWNEYLVAVKTPKRKLKGFLFCDFKEQV